MSELIDMADAVHRSYHAALARRSGGEVLVDDDLLLWAGTDPRPWIVNCAMGTGPAAPERVVDRARDFFDQRGHGFCVTLRHHTDGELRDELEREGFVEAIELPVMVTTRRLHVAAPAGYVLRTVRDDADVAAVAAVAAEAFGAELEGAVRSAFGRVEPALADDTTAALAFDATGPVAAAVSYTDGEAGGVYWVATRAAAQRQGLGAAATAAVTDACFERGATAVVLQASPMGAPLYRRLGFREITRYSEMQTPWPRA